MRNFKMSLETMSLKISTDSSINNLPHPRTSGSEHFRKAEKRKSGHIAELSCMMTPLFSEELLYSGFKFASKLMNFATSSIATFT